MSSKDIRLRFEELSHQKKFICTEQELNEFLSCGLLLKSKDKYINRQNKVVQVNVIKNLNKDFDINLTDVINSIIPLSLSFII